MARRTRPTDSAVDAVDEDEPPPGWLALWTRRFRFPPNTDAEVIPDLGEEYGRARALRFWRSLPPESRELTRRREARFPNPAGTRRHP